MSGVQQLLAPRVARQPASVSASAAAERASVAGESAPLSAAPRLSHALAGRSRSLHDKHGLGLLRHQAQVCSLLAARVQQRPAVVDPALLSLPRDLLAAMVMPVAVIVSGVGNNLLVAMVMTLTVMTTTVPIPMRHPLLSDGGTHPRRIRPGHYWPGALRWNVHALSEKRRNKHRESQR